MSVDYMSVVRPCLLMLYATIFHSCKARTFRIRNEVFGKQ